jgi:hypothetical protein
MHPQQEENSTSDTLKVPEIKIEEKSDWEWDQLGQTLETEKRQEHNSLWWGACYDDGCGVHLEGKNSAGWFPKEPRTPYHRDMPFRLCYNDACRIHKAEKESVGIYPNRYGKPRRTWGQKVKWGTNVHGSEQEEGGDKIQSGWGAHTQTTYEGGSPSGNETDTDTIENLQKQLTECHDTLAERKKELKDARRSMTATFHAIEEIRKECKGKLATAKQEEEIMRSELLKEQLARTKLETEVKIVNEYLRRVIQRITTGEHYEDAKKQVA